MGLLIGLALVFVAQRSVALHSGMTISESCTIAPRDFMLPSVTNERLSTEEERQALKPALKIHGDNLVVDFKGAILRGSPADWEPDKRLGLGMDVQGKNITLKNLHVRGYKVGLWAKNCSGLKIINGDFSCNWKQHLMSTVDKEDEGDWQSYHHNEQNEWLRYGAGMYLEGCRDFQIQHCIAHGGQCGLMLVRSNHGLIWNNDLSFLSGVGLGLYRSSGNRVLNNKLDWCVRGFSYGVYNRGQDSAGILIFEQSNANIFAFNSVTHGGDGFFLWAGQTTMDTGKGGCNGNILYGNDFSNSPCNGIEATFSSNTFVNNKIVECWHGIWGGYSFDTKILGNVFGFNGEAIAIEHGQNNSINYNLFQRDEAGIDLWQDPITDKNWAYPKYHDTQSRDYQIYSNDFKGTTTTAVAVRNTTQALIGSNRLENCGAAFKESGSNPKSRIDGNHIVSGEVPPQTIDTGGRPSPGTSDDVAEYLKRFDIPWAPFADLRQLKAMKRQPTEAEQRVLDSSVFVAPIAGGQSPFLPKGALRGQRYILVDEWGPYDFKSPLLWPRRELNGSGQRRFEILGPKGRWRLVSKTGVQKLSATEGRVPGFVDVEFASQPAALTKIELEYVGEATTDYRGIETPKGKPVRFAYSNFFVPIYWDVKFFKWDSSSDPRTQADAFSNVISGKPIKEVHLKKLDYAGGVFEKEVGGDHFATICNGAFDVAPGTYTLELTTDDGARVWVDGKPVITDAWHYQAPTLYKADLVLDGSQHRIRVDHFQIDGFAELKVSLSPRKP